MNTQTKQHTRARVLPVKNALQKVRHIANTLAQARECLEHGDAKRASQLMTGLFVAGGAQ